MITVFTSTYNRAYCLKQLYMSLRRQTCSSFEWLVIDDASTDETSEMLKSWKEKENSFPIKIIQKQTRGGLQRAINLSYQLASYEWIIKVDSDDYLLDDAIENLINWALSIKEKPMCLGVGGLFVRSNGDLHLQNGELPDFNESGYIDSDFFARSSHNLCIDTIELYRKSIRKNYEIPVWPSELDGPERVSFSNMAKDGYYIRWFNKAIAVVNYQEDGMSLNSEKMRTENPMSMAICFNYYSSYSYYSIIERIRFSSEFVFYSMLGREPKYILQTRSFFHLIFGLPIGLIKYGVKIIK